MRAFTKVLAGGVVAAALFSAAPAAAQYYPGYGYGYGGNVVGQVLSQVLGGGLGGLGGYGYNGSGYGGGVNSQAAVGQCVNAVQARLARSYSYGPYGSNAYGYGGYGSIPNSYAYGQARVLGVSSVEPRAGGGMTIRGVANSGAAGYAAANQGVDLTFKCKTDYRGFITSVSVDRAQVNYGYNGYTPYNGYNQYNQNNPYEAYGYRRY